MKKIILILMIMAFSLSYAKCELRDDLNLITPIQSFKSKNNNNIWYVIVPYSVGIWGISKGDTYASITGVLFCVKAIYNAVTSERG